MSFPDPYRRNPSKDRPPTAGGPQGGDDLYVRSHAFNQERCPSTANNNGDKAYDGETSSNAKRDARSFDEDWFEDRLAQQAQSGSPNGPTRKAGWNQWVAPNLHSTKQTSGARATNGGQHTNEFTVTPNGGNDAGRRSPPIHPDRRNFAGRLPSSRSTSFEKTTHQGVWPPTVTGDDDIAMANSSDFQRRPKAGQEATETLDPRPPPPWGGVHSTDPRRFTYSEKRASSIHSSGHASPNSVTGFDSGKHSLREHERSFEQQSTARWPKQPPTAPRKMSSNSFPPPPPPPPPPSSSTSMTFDSNPQMNNLLAVLSDFTDHVSDMASVNVRRENIKKQLVKQEAEYVKWRKQHASFPPLAEQQEKNRASAQKEFEELDKKMKQHIKNRDELARAIAISVISERSESESGRVQFLENELGNTRSEVHGLRAELNQAASEYGQIRALQRDYAKTQNSIADLNQKLGKMMAGSTAQPPVATTCDGSSIITLEKQISKLQERLAMILSRVDDIPNLKLDLSKSKQEVRDLNNSINVQADGLRELKETIMGENDDKGLIDVIATVEEDVEKIRGALTTVNEELGDLHSEVHKLGGRMVTVERGIPRRETPQPAPGVPKRDDTELWSALEAIKKEVADVQSGLTLLRGEQEEKDELVGGSIDAIESSTSKLDEAVRTNRSDMEAAISRINSSISTLQARASTPATASNPPTPQALTNGAWKPDEIKKIHDALKQHRHALDRQRGTNTCLEGAWQSLEDRFNGLTTDRLGQNMVHQMSVMYPYAANTQKEFDLARQRDEQLRQDLDGLFNDMAQLQTLVADISLSNSSEEQLKGLQQRVDNLSGDIETIRTQPPNSGIENGVSLRESLNSLATEVDDLTLRADDVRDRTAAELASHSLQIERLNEHCGIEAAETQTADAGVTDPTVHPGPIDNYNNGETEPRSAVRADKGPAHAAEPPAPMRRTHLLNKKRKRTDTSESDSGDHTRVSGVM